MRKSTDSYTPNLTTFVLITDHHETRSFVYRREKANMDKTFSQK